MNSIADMGGMHGFGPVVQEVDEPLFHEDWERRTCGVNLAAFFLGVYNADETRFATESMEPAEYLATPYYEHWLHSLEQLLVQKGLLTSDELKAGHISAQESAKSAAKPDKEQYWSAFRMGGSIAMPSETPQRFQVGDKVLARNFSPAHHTRLPRYVRGRKGTIVAHHGGFGFADTRAQGHGDHPQHLYGVRFEGRDLWGPDAGPSDAIHLDLYDSYLEPAS